MQKFLMNSVSATDRTNRQTRRGSADGSDSRGTHLSYGPVRSLLGALRPLVNSAFVANIKSQKKRNLQNERRRVFNKSVRSALKTATKKARTEAAQGDLDAAAVEARAAVRDLDKAASRGVIHKRTAARRKSRLARELARAAETP